MARSRKDTLSEMPVGYRMAVYRGPRKGEVRVYKTRAHASRMADIFDREYGAYCTTITAIWGNEK